MPAGLPQPTETIDLWPDGAPGMPGEAPAETVVERSTDPALTDRAVYGITRPRLAVFRSLLSNGTGSAETANHVGASHLVSKPSLRMVSLS